MASATRGDNGRWEIIPEEGDHPTFNGWLARFFNSLDPIFTRAKELGPSTNANFGKVVISQTVDPDQRPYTI